MKTKIISFVFVIFSFHCLFGEGADSGRKFRDFKGAPEDFAWTDYVNEGRSTYDEMVRAQEGVAVLKQRIDALCTEYKKLLASRKENEAIELFDEMQMRWQQAANAEVALIGLGWSGGTGEKAAVPKARLACYLRRVKELKELKACCLLLNE